MAEPSRTGGQNHRLPDPVAQAWRSDFVSLAEASSGECIETLDASRTGIADDPARPRLRTWLQTHGVLLVPGAAALALVAFLYRAVSAGVELLLLTLVLVALGVGHLVIRSRLRRMAAEHEANRVRDELALRATVADCEARRTRLADFSKLAAQIAHEVRNPLSSIVLNAELLDEELEGCSMPGMGEVRGLVSSIRAEAERLHALTDEYLMFARLPALEREPTSLNHVVLEFAQFVEAEAHRHRVEVLAVTDPEDPQAVVDRRQIRQVFHNLVRNAIEAMPDGGRVTLRAGSHGSRVHLEVADTGPGVAPDLRESIFEPFFSTKSRGTGLGLSVARRVVREHGGDIEVGGHPGARFRVWFPAAGRTAGRVVPVSTRRPTAVEAPVR